MENNLYVGNLNWQTSEEEVKELFQKCGTVQSVKLIIDFQTGRSKGFGFIEMSSQEEAEKAIRELNGQNFMERQLRVNLAKPQKKRGFRKDNSYSKNRNY